MADVEREQKEAVVSGSAQIPVVREINLPRNETEKPEIPRFSPEQREALEKEGYVIYELTGKTIEDLRGVVGNYHQPMWLQYDPIDKSVKSKTSEVAINPEKLFLPESDNKRFTEQKSLVAEFSEDISTKIPGVEAIIGEAPDYVELASLSRLFRHNMNYIRTQTEISSGLVYVYVGNLYPSNLYPDGGFMVDRGCYDSRLFNLFIVPLVVPKKSSR